MLQVNERKLKKALKKALEKQELVGRFKQLEDLEPYLDDSNRKTYKRLRADLLTKLKKAKAFDYLKEIDIEPDEIINFGEVKQYIKR